MSEVHGIRIKWLECRRNNLAEPVRRFPALYDKTQKEFKDKNVTSLIWATVATNLKLKSGKQKFPLYTLGLSKPGNKFKGVDSFNGR